MGGSRTEVLLLLLTGIVLLLMVAIIGLFLRMNQLQREVLVALEPLRRGDRPEGLPVGSRAPSFSLPDLSGRLVSLEDFAGQRLLLVFASPQCPACREMYPHLRAFAEAHPAVAVVMVSLGTVEENRRVAEEQGLGFPVLMGDAGVTQAYQVPGVPFGYGIDEDRVIRSGGFAGTREEIEALVRALGD